VPGKEEFTKCLKFKTWYFSFFGSCFGSGGCHISKRIVGELSLEVLNAVQMH